MPVAHGQLRHIETKYPSFIHYVQLIGKIIRYNYRSCTRYDNDQHNNFPEHLHRKEERCYIVEKEMRQNTRRSIDAAAVDDCDQPRLY